jgi:hypothetical protein
MLQLIERLGIASGEEVEIDTVSKRLVADADASVVRCAAPCRERRGRECRRARTATRAGSGKC